MTRYKHPTLASDGVTYFIFRYIQLRIFGGTYSALPSAWKQISLGGGAREDS
jgi:hypothetical protein